MLLSKFKLRLSLSARILFLGITLSFVSCSSRPEANVDSRTILHDDLFPDYIDVAIESSQDVFSINKTIKAFVDSNLNRHDDPDKKIKDLASAIFGRTNLNLLYQDDANTVAEETFKNGAANCLSLTILSYAMADYADLGVEFQQIEIPGVWTRKENTTVLNRHVNLKLFQKKEDNITLFVRSTFQLDFDSQVSSLHMPGKRISKSKVLALFYNNKGAEALIDKNMTVAYAYFRKALFTDPYLVEALANLGVLYHRAGENKYAEDTYNTALAIKQNDTTVLENLASIYSITDRQKQAENIRARLKEKRKNNPYYYYNLGEIEFENKNWEGAKKHYRKAISLNKKQHIFYFALAKVYFLQGEIKLSKKYIALAKKHTPSEEQQLLYQNKLNLLIKQWSQNL